MLIKDLVDLLPIKELTHTRAGVVQIAHITGACPRRECPGHNPEFGPLCGAGLLKPLLKQILRNSKSLLS